MDKTVFLINFKNNFWKQGLKNMTKCALYVKMLGRIPILEKKKILYKKDSSIDGHM